jgi:phospholipase/carboxylesterase
VPTRIDSTTYLHNNWVFKAFSPSPPYRNELFILLHGWTGDENSMDIFTRAFPTGAWLISPRAPFPSPTTGYSWLPILLDLPAAREKVEGIASEIEIQILEWKRILKIPLETPTHLVGFSQGGALALLFSMLNSNRFDKTACLSGFLPEWSVDLIYPQSLENQTYLIIHGLNDQTIPVDRARTASQILQNAGATVTYHENPIGHKLAAAGFNTLKEFYT